MRKHIDKIDLWVLSKATHFSHKTQRLAGITCFLIAKAGIAMALLAVSIVIADYWFSIIVAEANLFVLIAFSLWAFFSLYTMHECDRASESLYSGNTLPRWILRQRETARLDRLFWLALFLLDLTRIPRLIHLPNPVLEIVAANFLSLGLAIYYYFISVDPLPPGKSKVRKWLESLFVRLVPIHSEN